MSTTGHHDSHTPEDIRSLWQTPRWFFDYWNRYYQFAADIAASDLNHLVETFFTEQDDALTMDFSELRGRYVYCNPPYRDLKPWIELFARNARDYGIGTVALLPADTSTKWFKLAAETADQIVFITGGRLSFVRADTQESVGGNTKGSVVVIYHNRADRLQEDSGGSCSFYCKDRDFIKSISDIT